MSDRIYSIDSTRAIAMVFVVAIHADPFRGIGTYGNAANFVIESTGRFAVPFFFVTAGYLFAAKRSRTDGRYVSKYVTRVTSLYGRALVVYAPIALVLAAGMAVGSERGVANAVIERGLEAASPLGLVYYGDSVAFHLWFLPALVISIALVYAFVATEKTRYLLPVAIAFHAVGILGETTGVHVPLETRDALFFGFFYTSLGYCLRSWDWSPDPSRRGRYLALAVLFGIVHLLERYALGYVLGDASMRHGVYEPEYTLATALFVAALFVFLLSSPSLGRTTRLPEIGANAVLIYVAHPIVLYSLDETAKFLGVGDFALPVTLLWHLLLVPVAYVGTLALAVLVVRADVVQRLSDAISHRRSNSTMAGQSR
ncbi:acyltransferase [Halopiger goleimassiliensis]|uniref:acyltransferase n=1 Tax=Halopiger goleimassiliensis TaxID=1293048 RepID=UPI000677CF96|nr:acyltransferase family protein [Halopiger goleimassiliensis]